MAAWRVLKRCLAPGAAFLMPTACRLPLHGARCIMRNKPNAVMPMNRPGAVAAAHMGADSYADAQPTAAHEKIKNSRRGATDGRGVLHRGLGVFVILAI